MNDDARSPPTITIYQDQLRTWRFTLHGAQHELRLRAGVGFSSLESVQKAVEDLRREAQHEELFKISVNSRGKHFAVAVHPESGIVLGVSQNFEDREDLLAELASVRAELPEATIQEEC